MRPVPTAKTMTVWHACGRRFLRRDAAYYAIAKQLVLKRYPRWLDDNLEDEEMDELARQEGIADWRARREKRERLFWKTVSDFGASGPDSYEHFDPERWQRFLRRVASFLMFIDRRGAELAAKKAA